MRKQCVLTLLFGLLCCSSIALAENVAPQDFAYGMKLQTSQRGILYKLKLNEEIYRSVTKNDLSDLLVFNRRGDIVPFAIKQPQKKPVRVSQSQKLPFFPVYGESGKAVDSLSLSIKTDQTGKIINYETTQDDSKKVIQSYLIDASSLDFNAGQLLVDWFTNEESFIVPVSVEHSNDLTNWQPLVKESTLVGLRYEEYTLGRKTIDISSRHMKYLKLSWPQAGQGSFLLSVEGSFRRETNTAQLPNWIEVDGTRNSDSISFEYDCGGVFPIGGVNLMSSQSNIVLQAVVKSRATSEQEWRTRYAGLFYDLKVDGTALKNNNIHIPLVRDRYWRVELEPASAGVSNESLKLMLGWEPDELQFIAQGNPPFTLAFGNIMAESVPKKSAERLFYQFRKMQRNIPSKMAQTSTKTVLGGSEKLLPKPPPLPWKVWLLWGTLIISVFILAWMAWRLYKQMNLEGEK